jgi:hypothetical protein
VQGLPIGHAFFPNKVILKKLPVAHSLNQFQLRELAQFGAISRNMIEVHGEERRGENGAGQDNEMPNWSSAAA